MNINIQKIKNLFTKNAIYYSLSLIIFLGFGLTKFLLPEVNKMVEQRKKIAEYQMQISDFQRQLDSAKKVEEAPKPQSPLSVSIYNPPYPGMNVEDASVDLVDQLILMIRDTQNRIVEISFAAQPVDPAKPANTLTLNMSLNSTYVNFQSFLQQIYVWKYLAGIKNITISPLNGDYSTLDIKLTIDLYLSK